tara:strand:- start:105 stop:1157 length:1053 start_codon:yes stop_codon:yes gene_type:complete
VDKVILFKSDSIGDLIVASPCLKIIKDNKKNSHITLICSKYNFQAAKNYPFVDKMIVFDKKNTFMNIIKNFKTLFLTRYTYLFQFDGKNSSYLISYFIRSNIKSTICFVKYKKIFGIGYLISRPAKLLLKIFFNNYIICDERYSSKDKIIKPVHYQTNYFDILKKLNFKITNQRGLFYLENKYEIFYKNFFRNFINNNFYLFHFDEKWDNYKDSDFKNSLKIINKLSKKNKVIITTGLKKFRFLADIEKKFNVFSFKNDVFNQEISSNTNNVVVLKNIPLNLLAYFIKNSEVNYNSHSGSIVHISVAFDKKIVDLIPKHKNDELDRWVPALAKYKRINFEDINDELIEII